MTDGYRQLAESLRVISTLLPQTGLDRRGVFDLGHLSYETSLSEEDLRVLLAGRKIPLPGFGAEVQRRIRFLAETRQREYETEDGAVGRRTYTRGEIAKGCGITTAWLSQLLIKPKIPKLAHSKSIADFFGVPVEFLTDEPPKALARVLNADVIPRLRGLAGGSADTVATPAAMRIALRLGDREMDPEAEAALLLFIDRIAASPKSP
ncbi:helix-turn-helix transcriptional regulator [Streptomyces sp. NPDC020875]|uniref:helix-turn-helix domain-containing protein n=1 Tax=Streptomyces sp. NPDC020875 TaxID=3154898 RepID=UPI0033DFD521